MYVFVFDGNVSLTTEVEIILENVAGIPQNSAEPDVPDAPVVSALDEMLTLLWIAVQGAEHYEVYVNTAQQPPESPIKTVTGTTTVLTELTNKTAYYIWIKAVNSSGSSDFSPYSRGIPWP
ncbi:fibronectin type III domain-containing protein, partial [Treponema sp. R80B11-R83G3]